MTMRSTLIVLAMFATLPGADAPAQGPATVETKPGDPPKTWLTAVSPLDGRHIQVFGWMEGTNVRYRPEDNPQLYGRAPKPAPATAQPPHAAAPTGVIADKLPNVKPGASWYGGNAPHRAEAGGLARKPDVFLTIIGPEAERRATVERLRRDPEFAQVADRMGDRLAINAYEPGNPMVAGVGLPANGRPDIVIQDATGKELNRHQADPGPVVLVAEIRKADPQYRPGLEPQADSDIPREVWLGLAGLAILFILRAKGHQS
ncbi:hypothetical protein P12x_003070 [Tundrisphaera lichenicola]|uniref:hypothetical protein n=1 Tax=Tundrisphaera lichenicola TaxID=2029860 RepID=UPI003EBC1E54